MKVILALAIALLPTLALAQDSCPAKATCYEGHELEFDIADGQIQYLVVQTTVTTVTSLDGQSTRETIRLAEFVSDGDQFKFVDDFDVRKEGEFASASLGDTFTLTEVSQ